MCLTIKSDMIKSGMIKSDMIKSDMIKSDMIKSLFLTTDCNIITKLIPKLITERGSYRIVLI